MPSPDSGAAQQFRKFLLTWYDESQRRLPWRGETDPYRILVSEIMLQQTRVAVVQQRYLDFLSRFPTIDKLARAREQSVLAAWSGLGYYRRARALHAAAKQILQSGRFPRSAADLQELPGIGRYTASAVASIAFGEPVAVVDGNVKRVLDRIYGDRHREEDYWTKAGNLVDPHRPGDFNQAMMELGATICLPGGEPRCTECPVAELCRSRGTRVERPNGSRRKAEISYLLTRRNGSVLLRQRPHDFTLMPGMWELPECALRRSGGDPILRLRHSITVTDYTVLVFDGAAKRLQEGKWVSLNDVERLPLTGLTRKILRGIQKRTE